MRGRPRKAKCEIAVEPVALPPDCLRVADAAGGRKDPVLVTHSRSMSVLARGGRSLSGVLSQRYQDCCWFTIERRRNFPGDSFRRTPQRIVVEMRIARGGRRLSMPK